MQYQALFEILEQNTNGTVASQAQVNHLGTLTMEPSHKTAAQSPTGNIYALNKLHNAKNYCL